jgi:cbb3-type cytochrome oxidase maturation protein
MSIVFVALPFALLIAGLALAAFIWATRTGQFDDLETPSYRMLFEDDPSEDAEVEPDGDGLE